MNRAEWLAGKRRDALNLPTIACPNCGDIARHWVPEDLDNPGHYTCTPTKAATT